ncbi:glycosyltransferase [Hymenobacter nivis]|nr:glycosyltransferase [Hymenobacter nivis]
MSTVSNKLRRKNILLLIPQLTYGGAERVFHDHGQELARHHRVIECVFDSRTEVAFPTQNQLVALDVPAGTGPLGKLRALVQRVQRVRALKREHEIDLCISHLEGADYLNLLSKGTEKVVLCIHNSKRHDPNIQGAIGALRRRVLMPVLYRAADLVVAVSRDLRQELLDTFGLQPAQVVTINNFFDVEGIRTKSREVLPSEEEDLFSNYPVLISAGRLSPEKNQLGLLPVLRLLQTEGQMPQARLVLLGDGPQREELLARCQQLGLRAWSAWQAIQGPPDPVLYDVFLFGFQANPFRYISRATVSVMPSDTEGFPMALCEAMACGVPVAATDCPTGPREILAPDTPATQRAEQAEWAEYGLLLPLLTAGTLVAQNTSEWSGALASLLREPVRRQQYAAQALQRVQHFAPGPIMQQWETVIQTL